jgi:RNA polymerase sigma-70 factor (ECF subfamily)
MKKTLSRTDNEIAKLYERHVHTVYRVCFTYMKNPTDTEDAVSDTFVKLIKTAPTFESQEHEKAWLIRTASNVCKDVLKHWWRKRENLDDHASDLKTEDSPFMDTTLAVVLSLSEKYKTVVYLYYYEGYNTVEIADILQKPQSTVRNYLHEARNVLRQKLGGEFDEK